MGTRGPIPERSEHRLRTNQDEGPIETVPVIGTVKPPKLGDISYAGETHPLVEDMWNSMIESAQSKFFEPSDWQYARLTLFALNQELIASRHAGKPMGSMKLAALNQMMTSLLMTEGERRRVRIEIERSEGSGGKVISLADAFKAKLTGSS